MRKLIFCCLLLLIVSFVHAEVIVQDDFNRPDNQDVSANYVPGFIYYETPLIDLDNITQYNGEDEVEIRNNELFLQETDYCDFTTIVADFSHIINLTSYEDGNISFRMTTGDNGGSERWFGHIVFGDSLSNSPSATEQCATQNKMWNTINSANDKDTFVFVQVVRAEGKNNVREGGACGYLPYFVENIGDGTYHEFTFYFNILNNKTKFYVNGILQTEINCNIENAEKVNSIAFQTYTNQGNVIEYMKIDDLKINKPAPTVNLLLQKFSPVFYHHPDEDYELNEIASMFDNADLKKGTTLVKSSPITVDDITDLLQSHKHSMDLTNVNIDILPDLPDPNDFSSNNPKLYGTISIDENNYKHLQYFIFYPFQEWYVMDHEGDWELVQVTLDPNNEIESVAYMFNLFTMIYYDPTLIDYVDGTHPIVWVAKGSHNSYPDNAYLDFSNIEGNLDFFEQLLNAYKLLEDLSQGGRVMKPEGMLLDPNEETYVLEEITSSTPWIEYEGMWGQETNFIFTSGPQGPKHNPRFERKWRHPERFTYAPENTFFSAFLYSPLDFEVLDENSNLITDYEFYTGPDNEPETLMLLGEKYTLNLIANDAGTFTLEIYFYHKDANTGIKVRYENIPNGPNTRGKVEVHKDSDFLLYIDFDGNGVYATTHSPNEIVDYNDFEISDTDNDGINNFEDNCPLILNPGQENFNNDGKGDACDNPKYLKQRALKMLKDVREEDPNNYNLKRAEIYLGASLRNKFWLSDFTIRSLRVFYYEKVAFEKLDGHPDIQMLLVDADKLLAERRILDKYSDKLKGWKKKQYDEAVKLYEEGNKAVEDENFLDALYFYMMSWETL